MAKPASKFPVKVTATLGPDKQFILEADLRLEDILLLFLNWVQSDALGEKKIQELTDKLAAADDNLEAAIQSVPS